MTPRSRFRIVDLVMAVAAAGGASAGLSFMTRASSTDAGEAVFWMIVGGYAALAYYVVRFVPSRAARLLTLGVALAFAGSAVGIYTFFYLRMGDDIAPLVLGLSAVALLLVAGGLAHGLIDHWHERRNPPVAPNPAHPLDRDESP